MPTVLVTGANRGLGLEFVRQYATDGWRVHACCRAPQKAGELKEVAGDVTVHPLDVADTASVAALARALHGESIDVLVNNAGVYGRRQSLGRIDYDEWLDVLRTDTLAPVALTEALLPNLERGEGKRVALITSQMGSIADNTSGGVYAYRSAKAALNAAGRSLAVDLKPGGIIVLLLHPGWVRTDMGGSGGKIDAAESVAALRDGIADAKPAHSGRFFRYDGREIPW
jgi:NAD(P)-dependent dehydrogenase (short-subunit alcohol dehydrogenase family)